MFPFLLLYGLVSGHKLIKSNNSANSFLIFLSLCLSVFVLMYLCVCSYVLFVCSFNFRFSLLFKNVWLYFCISVFIFINVFVLFPKKCVYVSVSVFVSVFITSFTDIFYHDPLLLPVLFSSLFRKDIDRQGRPPKSAANPNNNVISN